MFGIQCARSTRYLADTPLWQVGAIWILAEMAVLARARGPELKRWNRLIPLALVTGLMIAVAYRNICDAWEQWTLASRYRRDNSQICWAIVNSDQLADLTLQKKLRANDRIMEYAPRAIEIMKKYKLNVYRFPHRWQTE